MVASYHSQGEAEAHDREPEPVQPPPSVSDADLLAWFNTPEYRKLYAHRDIEEAEEFVRHFMLRYSLREVSGARTPVAVRIIDAGCGWGRFLIAFARYGYSVIGLDLAPQMVEDARRLLLQHRVCGEVYQHDIRKPWCVACADLVLNMFSSFGYWAEPMMEQCVIEALKTMVKPGGYLVLDYLNTFRIREELAGRKVVEYKMMGDSLCTIEKFIAEGFIWKVIRLADGRVYYERLRFLMPQELVRLFRRAGLSILALWGNYFLRPFHPAISDRFIILARKP